jgi:hypothetical integral membrane protein (TIGR02206 family)
LFVQFGTSHLAALAICFGAGLGLIAAARYSGRVGVVRAMSLGLASILVALWMISLTLLFRKKAFPVAMILPMHLCDWTTLVVIATLVSFNERTYELAYFWGFGATLQALLTPDLNADFPHPQFIIFFGLHGTVIASILFLTLGLGMRPWPSSVARVAFWSLVYLITAFLADRLFHANFGYLVRKPTHPSLLSLFPPWPYYVGEMILVGGALILLLYAPFFVRDRLATKAPRL